MPDEKTRIEKGPLLIVLVCSLIVLTLLGLSFWGQKSKHAASLTQEQTVNDMTGAEQSGLQLLLWHKKGYINVEIAAPTSFIHIRHDVWTSLSPQEQQKFCRMALDYFSAYAKDCQGRSQPIPAAVLVKDRIGQENLALILIDSGKIDIR